MSARSPITTHVLDVSIGRPAEGIPVSLVRLEPEDRTASTLAATDLDTVRELATGRTDADGRASQLLPPGPIEPGTYRLRFAVARYFARDGRTCFYPHVDIVFVVGAGDEHYHVPLLLSPFGYSTYRGS